MLGKGWTEGQRDFSVWKHFSHGISVHKQLITYLFI